MPFRLIRRDGNWPPAGWVFQDPRTGQKFDGMSADFKAQVLNVITHRFANAKKYDPSKHEFFDYESVAVELEEYTCLRLGQDKRYCFDTEKSTRRTVEAPIDGSEPNCPACGNLMVKKKCATCSGIKYKGWQCPRCYSEIA